MSELYRLTERVLIYSFEAERDRPNLGYIRGDRRALAVDAGHSAAHTREFYAALSEAGYPLPDMTVLTHWHWDHTLGMHACHGPCIASAATNGYLLALRDRVAREGEECLLSLDGSVRLEYASGAPVTVTPADILFDDRLAIDLGGCEVRLFRSVSPHTDDATLIHVPGERVLFLGDSTSGPFPTWEREREPSRCLLETIEDVDADIFMSSHASALTMDDLREMLLF